jgi:TRAP-type C4-dicarboxylate transport system permease small subunit
MENGTHNAVNRLTAALEHFMSIALAVIFTVVLLLVVLRYFFSTTIIGGNEATAVAFVFVTAIGAAVDLFKDRHISVTWFTDRLDVAKQRYLAKARYVLLAALNVIVLYYSIVWIGRTGSFLMPALGLPQWVAQACIPIGCTLSIAYCVLRIIGIEAEPDDEYEARS